MPLAVQVIAQAPRVDILKQNLAHRSPTASSVHTRPSQPYEFTFGGESIADAAQITAGVAPDTTVSGAAELETVRFDTKGRFNVTYCRASRAIRGLSQILTNQHERPLNRGQFP